MAAAIVRVAAPTRDARTVIGVSGPVGLMLAALMIYLTSYELAWWPRGQSRQPILAPAGN